MRALEQDMTKRPGAAKEMLRALPVPPPKPSGKLGASGGFAGSSAPGSTMSTIVLDRSAANPAPTNAAARGASRSGAPASTMPTIVLSDPVAEKIKSGGSPGGSAAKRVGPQIKKAIELGGKARDLIERRLKSGLAAMNSGAAQRSPSVRREQRQRRGHLEGAGAAGRAWRRD